MGLQKHMILKRIKLLKRPNILNKTDLNKPPLPDAIIFRIRDRVIITITLKNIYEFINNMGSSK